MAGDSPAKTADAKRAAQLELARKGRDKRKAVATAGSMPKRTRMSTTKESSSKSGDSSKIASPGKEKTSTDVINAEPVSSAPPASTAVPTPPVVTSVTDAPFTTTSTPKSADKGKKKEEEVMTVNFTLPSDFMADDVLDRTKLFPHLGKFHLPPFQERFKDASVDDMGSHAAGLSFMAFQANLSLYSHMEIIRRLVPKALERERAALEREKRALEREKVAVDQERVAKDQAEAMSVRLDDALNALEVAGHEKDELKGRLQEALILTAASKVEKEQMK